MVDLKRTLIGAAGVAIGIMTLRRIRNRRMNPRQKAETATREALNEASQAVEHSVAAIEHAQIAGENAVKVAGELGEMRDDIANEFGEMRTDITGARDDTSSSPIQRLRNIGKGRR